MPKFTVIVELTDDDIFRPLCAVEGDVKVWPNPGLRLARRVVDAETPGEAADLVMADVCPPPVHQIRRSVIEKSMGTTERYLGLDKMLSHDSPRVT